MFLGLLGILALAWIISFVVLHVSSALIHLLLLAAIIAGVLHFVTGRSSGNSTSA
ncbi:MAG TPA: hypothetical protein VN222_01975 [Novosphingobium sp.]|nr:hypothetical protein [Novosphingobium sp.]